MTSHEMRNPLSAIFQCGDAILASLAPLQQAFKGTADDETEPDNDASSRRLQKSLAYAVESAATIILCAQHQKR